MWALAESSRDYQHQNLPGVDHPPPDDFMELLDLENQVSSPSSSESSCVTISSDECFDSLALLQDLEPENNQKDANCKFSVSAPVKPNEVVVHPVTSGLSTFLTVICFTFFVVVIVFMRTIIIIIIFLEQHKHL